MQCVCSVKFSRDRGVVVRGGREGGSEGKRQDRDILDDRQATAETYSYPLEVNNGAIIPTMI